MRQEFILLGRTVGPETEGLHRSCDFPEETWHYQRVLSWGVTQLELHIRKMAWLPCGKWAGGAGVKGVPVRMLLTRDDASVPGGIGCRGEMAGFQRIGLWCGW